MDLNDIDEKIRNLLKRHIGVLRVQKELDEQFEVSGTIETMQGKKKVAGIYFASVIAKPKDVRFYFFPIYTHKAKFDALSPELQKMLKGKSCFHIKKLDLKLEQELMNLIDRGIKLYQEDNMLAIT